MRRKKVARDKEKKAVGKRLVEMFELPKEVVFNLPIIQALGYEEISVTNYKGLLELTDSCVRIGAGTGVIRIEGARLVLKHVTSEAVSITGRIEKIEFNN